MTQTKTPGYNSRLQIFFQNGRAYYWSPTQMRAFPLARAKAELFIATDAATLISRHPMKQGDGS